VTSSDAEAASSGVSRRGRTPERSKPASAMASTTSGCTRSPGSVPADVARARAGSASALKSAAAICERPALWTQAKTTFAGPAMAVSGRRLPRAEGHRAHSAQDLLALGARPCLELPHLVGRRFDERSEVIHVPKDLDPL